MSHWSNVSLRVVAQFQRDPFEKLSDDEVFVSCDWTKELFVNSSDPDLIKNLEETYEALGRLEQGGITYLNISLYEMFNISNVVITLLQ